MAILNSSLIELTDTTYPSQVILETTCPLCGKKQQMSLVGDKAIAYRRGKEAYAQGARIQDAFPTFTVEEREFIQTGICSTCWDNV